MKRSKVNKLSIESTTVWVTFKNTELFYSERKKIMKDDDFKIIEEVNKIYQEQKPWGILYAEPKGDYSSSLMRDRKSSDIYKTFTAMYSPAYRKDENGNSPLRGIVDGKK